MSLILSNETTRASRRTPSLRSTCGSSIPATTCAFVTTRPGAGDPARPLDAEAAGVADHAHDAERGGGDAGGVEHGRIGRVDVCRRAGEGGERVDLRERVDQAPWGEILVERREDRRVLRVATELSLSRDIEENRADRPAEREPECGTEDPAADVVEHPERAEHEQAAAEAAADHRRRSPGRRRRSSIAPPSATSGSHWPDRRRPARGRRARRGRTPSASPARENTPTTRPRRKPERAVRTMSARAIRSTIDTLTDSQESGAPLRRAERDRSLGRLADLEPPQAADRVPDRRAADDDHEADGGHGRRASRRRRCEGGRRRCRRRRACSAAR